MTATERSICSTDICQLLCCKYCSAVLALLSSSPQTLPPSEAHCTWLEPTLELTSFRRWCALLPFARCRTCREIPFFSQWTHPLERSLHHSIHIPTTTEAGVLQVTRCQPPLLDSLKRPEPFLCRADVDRQKIRRFFQDQLMFWEGRIIT
jgi:hypothetical protein